MSTGEIGKSLTEMEKLESEIRSDPIKWAMWQLKDQTGGPWKARWYQKEIIDGIMNGDNRLAVRMGRRVGKCLPGWVNVFDPSTGRQVPIKELYDNKKATVSTMNSNYKVKETTTDQVWDNGVKEVIRVQLKSGRQIDGTKNHPLYRSDGWVEINDLRVGDKVATPKILDSFGNKELSDDIVKYIAYITGNNSTTCKHIEFRSTNEKVTEEFIQVTESLKNSKIYSIEDKYYVKKDSNSEALKILEESNLLGVSLIDKKIPDDIYQLPKEKISLFLSRLYSTDGWVAETTNTVDEVGIVYYSTSEHVARGVQHLLLRFGIQSILESKKCKKSKDESIIYYIKISGKENILKFINEINIYSKEHETEHIYNELNNKKENKEIETIGLIKDIEKLRKSNRMQSKDMISPNASMNAKQKRKVTPEKEELIYSDDVLSGDRIRKLSKGDIYWDEIVSIESLGSHQTYDLTIPETQNFIANDVIVHNTETMVVFCLWYAFHHKNARLLITAPYENQVRLIFMRLNELIDECEELYGSIKSRTKSPFITQFENGSSIMGFTVGATSGQSGASVRGQKADWIFMDEKIV